MFAYSGAPSSPNAQSLGALSSKCFNNSLRIAARTYLRFSRVSTKSFFIFSWLMRITSSPKRTPAQAYLVLGCTCITRTSIRGWKSFNIFVRSMKLWLSFIVPHKIFCARTTKARCVSSSSSTSSLSSRFLSYCFFCEWFVA